MENINKNGYINFDINTNIYKNELMIQMLINLQINLVKLILNVYIILNRDNIFNICYFIIL